MSRNLMIKLSCLVLVAIVSEHARATSVAIVCHFVPTNHCMLSMSITRESISRLRNFGDLSVVVSTDNLKLSNGAYRSSVILNGDNSSAETELDLVAHDGSIKFVENKALNLEIRAFDKLASISIKVASLPFEIEQPQVTFARIRVAVWIKHREVAVSEGTMSPEGCWYGGVHCKS